MQVKWERLAVVTAEGETPKKAGWVRNPKVFAAETCARQIHIGFESEFKNIPDEFFKYRGSAIYYGRDAYIFLGKFMTGLKSHHHVDIHALGQVRKAWNNYCEKNPEDYKRLQPYVSALLRDARKIKSSILAPHLSRPTRVNTAVRMASLLPSDRVLVVGGAETITVDMITALGHKKRDTPETITLTHPSDIQLKNIVYKVQRLEKHRAIEADLVTIPFSQALQNHGDETTIYNAAAVFVCQPMQENTINQQLIDAWRVRSKMPNGNDAQLLHLKNDPLSRGSITGAWKTMQDTSGFISYLDIVQRNSERIADVKTHVQAAEQAVEDLSGFRMDGNKRMALHYDGMFMEYELLPRIRKDGGQPVYVKPFALART